MSFIHYLFLGYFEYDGEWVRFSKSPNDPVYRPVVRRPLETEAIQTALREVKGIEIKELAFPDDWRIWLDGGYLVCDKYTRNQEEIDFIACLVERTGCDIHDVSAHCDITLHDWLAVTRSYIVRKLKKFLQERFPLPDKVDLRDDDRIIGVVTSKRFRRLDTMQRQNLIHDILATHLTEEERRHVLLIVAVTPEEEAASADVEDE